jgi:hypothetical protein
MATSLENESNGSDSISLAECGISDAAQREDRLGFKPYVDAVADFLADERTRGPLTLSIEGDWGCGKSSFILQLEELLAGYKDKFTVNFNAWRHDKDDALWAAFALKFIRDIRSQMSRFERFKANLKLRALRYDWTAGWLPLIWAGFISVVFIAVSLGIVRFMLSSDFAAAYSAISKTDKIDSLFWQALFASGSAGYLVLSVFLLTKLKAVLADPLAIDLKRFVKTPSYSQHSAFLEEFHKDFDHILKAYVGDHRVFVFIDDLDRCDLPTAAELMRAINLMISESSRLIFVIGMDREKVAAGLAVKHEKLLPYLFPTAATGTDFRIGLEFGFSFIEKFIQLPFRIPQPTERSIDDFIQSINGVPGTTQDSSVNAERPDLVTIVDAADSAQVREIIALTAPTFEFNPRRIKQFLNTFRLKTHIASKTGLFSDSNPQFYALNLMRLGKFIAVSLRWPLIIDDLVEDKELFDKIYTLQRLTIQSKTTPETTNMDSASKWAQKKALVELLSARCDFSNEWSIRSHSLLKLDVEKLLRTSPARRPIAASETRSDNPKSRVESPLDSDHQPDPREMAAF